MVVNADVKHAVLRGSWRHERKADRTAERRRSPDARHASRDASLPDDEVTLLDRRRRSGFECKTDELLATRPFCNDRKAALAREERLVHFHGPAGANLERVREAVGVLAHDDV